jgi:replicative DNA helicase
MNELFNPENALIGMAIWNQGNAVRKAWSAGVRPEHFEDKNFGEAWGAIGRLVAKESQITFATVFTEIKSVESKKKICLGFHDGPVYRNLEADFFIDRLLEKEWIKETKGAAKNLYRQVDEKTTAETLAVIKRAPTSRGNMIKSADKIVEDFVTRFDNRAEAGRSGVRTSVPSGWTRLDEETGGWEHSTLTVIAGRPSMGKTALALQFCLNALRYKYSVLFFSLEMTEEQITNRLVANISGVDSKKVKRPHLMTEGEYNDVAKAGSILSGTPLKLCTHVPGGNLHKIKSEVERFAGRGEVDLVIIDQVSKIKVPGFQADRRQEVNLITNDLKQLAIDTRLPVIALNQIRRSSNSDMPTMSEMKESGSLEEDADNALLIHREGYYAANKNDGRNLLILDKVREGEKGMVIDFKYQPQSGRMSE